MKRSADTRQQRLDEALAECPVRVNAEYTPWSATLYVVDGRGCRNIREVRRALREIADRAREESQEITTP